MIQNIRGPLTALITPFSNGRVDTRSYQNLIAWQIAQGIAGIVPCGTTGETPTLSDEEQGMLFDLAVRTAAGRVPVIAGCGSNDTRHAIHLTRLAQDARADAALHVVPYYNKPTQEGMYQHFKAIHDATDIPVILYNIPGRSVVNMSIETQARLAQLPRIVGVKDATGDLDRVHLTRATCGDDFLQLTGEDANALSFLAQGGHGAISVTSNIAPAICAAMFQAWFQGNLDSACKINDRLMPLHAAMFCETSPGPVKYAAHRLGLCKPDMRLPMVPIAPESRDAVDRALRIAAVPAARVEARGPAIAVCS